MGRGAAYDLVRNDKVEQVICADINETMAKNLAKEMGDKAVSEKVDAKDKSQLSTIFSKER